MKKRLFLFFAIFFIAESLFAHSFYTDGVYYNIISDTTVEVTYKGSDYSIYNEYSGSVVIPSSVTYNGDTYSIIAIGINAFRNCSTLTSLTIGKSITSIRESAFSGCSSLASVVWNAKNCSISNQKGIFYYYNVTNLVHCPISSFTFGNEVEYIPAYLCSNLVKITHIEIPNSVTSIRGNTFSGCSGLTRVDISDLSAWCKIVFGGEYANPLYYAHNLYLNGELVTDLVIPETVDGIKANAFYFATCLQSVTIPNSVTSIGAGAFSGCSGLTRVDISDLAAWCKIDFINKYANPLFNVHNLYLNGELVADLVIPETVDSIKANAFSGATCLQSVTISRSVTSIGNWAFSECSNLDTVYNCSELVFASGSTSYGEIAKYASVVDNNYCQLYFIEALATSQNGSVSGAGRYAYGEVEELTAIPNAGYKFAKWSDGNTDNPRSIVVTQDSTFRADFVLIENAMYGVTSNTLFLVENSRVICDVAFEIYTVTGLNITKQNGLLPKGVYIVKIEKSAEKIVIR